MPTENQNNVNTSGGSVSDFGFAYQRLVFIKILIDNCFNLSDSFEYEGADDVSFSSKEDNLYSVSFKKTAIQCKTGNLGYDTFLKMFENWALIGDQDKYILFTENALEFEYNQTTIKESIKENVTQYMLSSKKKSKKSLLWRLANKYGFKNGGFSNNDIDLKIDSIFNNFCNPIVMDYKMIFEKTKESFIKDRIHDCKGNKTICERRFDYLISKINTIINNNESKRIKTTICFSDFNRILQNSILEINENKPYLREYVSFKKTNYDRICENEGIMNSLEGKLLKKIFDDEKSVVTHLVYEYYYKDLRDNYINNDENDKIDYAEMTAFENYLDTKRSDDLREYFDSVVNKDIQSPIIVNSQYRKGCYIFLSSESCSDDVFIDWGCHNGK